MRLRSLVWLAIAAAGAPAVAAAQDLRHSAQIQAWGGNYDQAIALYHDAIARRPRDVGLRSDLADVMVWAKRFEEAEHLYEGVLLENGQHHEALKGLAHVRMLRGDTGGAEGVLQHALRLYPNDADLYREQARWLSETGDRRKAVEALQQAVALAPDNVDGIRQLAESLQALEEWPKAIDAWLRVAALEPDAPAHQVALGRAYLAEGKLASAREHAALALRMGPTDAGALQLAKELDREAGLAPVRTAAEWLELFAYGALIPVVLLVAHRGRRVLRRRPVARIVATYVVPLLLAVKVVSRVMTGEPWHWIDAGLFDAGTEVVVFGGLMIAFVAVLRAEPKVPEFAGQVVLALGAHPDDIELGCAGFLLKLKASGAKVYGLTFTRGEKGTDRAGEREVEARMAANFLELDECWILDLPDTNLHDKVSELKAVIESKVRELGVTMLLTHTDVDVHGDHRAVFVATREAARAVPTVLCYEDVSTSGQFTPNLYVDVSSYIDDHIRACAFHRTQGHRTYMDPQVIQGRAAHRGMQAGVQFAIAYRTLNLIR